MVREQVKKVHTCETCNKTFPFPSVLAQHQRKKKGCQKPLQTAQKPDFSCQICNKSFRDGELLHQHLKAQKCARTSLLLQQAREQEAQAEENRPEFLCGKCSQRFEHDWQLTQHVLGKTCIPNSTLEEEFLCGVCQATFTDAGLLEQHLRESHVLTNGQQQAEEYVCGICRQSFSTNSELEQHMLSQVCAAGAQDSLSTDEFHCGACKQFFRSILKLEEHLNTGCLTRLVGVAAPGTQAGDDEISDPVVNSSNTFQQTNNVSDECNPQLDSAEQSCPEDSPTPPADDSSAVHKRELVLHDRESQGTKSGTQMISATSDSLPFICARCRKPFKAEDELYQHLLAGCALTSSAFDLNNCQLPVKCRRCGQDFRCQKDLDEHSSSASCSASATEASGQSSPDIVSRVSSYRTSSCPVTTSPAASVVQPVCDNALYAAVKDRSHTCIDNVVPTSRTSCSPVVSDSGVSKTTSTCVNAPPSNSTPVSKAAEHVRASHSVGDVPEKKPISTVTYDTPPPPVLSPPPFATDPGQPVRAGMSGRSASSGQVPNTRRPVPASFRVRLTEVESSDTEDYDNNNVSSNSSEGVPELSCSYSYPDPDTELSMLKDMQARTCDVVLKCLSKDVLMKYLCRRPTSNASDLGGEDEDMDSGSESSCSSNSSGYEEFIFDSEADDDIFEERPIKPEQVDLDLSKVSSAARDRVKGGEEGSVEKAGSNREVDEGRVPGGLDDGSDSSSSEDEDDSNVVFETEIVEGHAAEESEGEEVVDNSEQVGEVSTSQVSSLPSFSCVMCPKHFTALEGLIEHLKTHVTGEEVKDQDSSQKQTRKKSAMSPKNNSVPKSSVSPKKKSPTKSPVSPKKKSPTKSPVLPKSKPPPKSSVSAKNKSPPKSSVLPNKQSPDTKSSRGKRRLSSDDDTSYIDARHNNKRQRIVKQQHERGLQRTRNQEKEKYGGCFGKRKRSLRSHSIENASSSRPDTRSSQTDSGKTNNVSKPPRKSPGAWKGPRDVPKGGHMPIGKWRRLVRVHSESSDSSSSSDSEEDTSHNFRVFDRKKPKRLPESSDDELDVAQYQDSKTLKDSQCLPNKGNRGEKLEEKNRLEKKEIKVSKYIPKSKQNKEMKSAQKLTNSETCRQLTKTKLKNKLSKNSDKACTEGKGILDEDSEESKHRGEKSPKDTQPHVLKYRYICGLCQLRFQNQNALSKHIQKHASTAPSILACSTCGTVFSCQSALDRHKETHDNTYTTSSGDNADSTNMLGEQLGKFVCGICKTCFQTESELTEHLLTHYGSSRLGQASSGIDSARNSFSSGPLMTNGIVVGQSTQVAIETSNEMTPREGSRAEESVPASVQVSGAALPTAGSTVTAMETAADRINTGPGNLGERQLPGTGPANVSNTSSDAHSDIDTAGDKPSAISKLMSFKPTKRVFNWQ